MNSKFLFATLLVVLNVWEALPTPLSQNYSSEILRLAKAAQIKAYLDPELDACNDFYQYACERWERLHSAERQDKKTSYLDQLQWLYFKKSGDMLKQAHLSDSTADVRLKDFYSSCRNRDPAEPLEMDALLNVVQLSGGWPQIVAPSWYEDEYDWLKVIAEVKRKLGVDVLVGLDIVPDFEDEDMHRIKIGAPEFKLGGKLDYLDLAHKKQRENYKDDIEQMLRRQFSGMPDNWAQEVATQVLEVEQELVKGLNDNTKLSLKQTSRLRYAGELKAAYGNYVDLSRYLNLIFNQTIYVQIYETPEDYLSNLVDVIRKTPKLTIANYTMWRVLEKFNAVEAKQKEASNDDWCVHLVHKFFPQQLEHMFHRNHNHIQLINELQSVWADVKRTYRDEWQSSNRLDWIAVETRQKAIVKLEAMKLKVREHDAKTLEDQVKPLQLRKDKYFRNLITILQWQTKQHLSKLIEKPHSDEEEIQLPKYQVETNVVQVPLSFLQARFFWDAAYPHALKYGTLGALLAEQMLRGFDAVGRKHDQHGYKRSWWDVQSERGFDERASCFAKQYTKKWPKGNNAATTWQSVAQNGGISVAYNAYQKWWQNVVSQELQTQESLPLLNYTRNQIFYIGYAQLWCADYPNDVDVEQASAERWHVNSVLGNLYSFTQEFKCAPYTNMNPNTRCSIY